jgi:drug/metabolite transporter (DMT)-like permease
MGRSTFITFAVLSSVLSSIGWIYQGAAVHSLTPLIVASMQGIFAGVVYLAHLRISGGVIPLDKLRTHSKEFLQIVLLRGVLAGIVFCYALQLSDSIKLMFFTKLEPYFVLFWTWLLTGRKVSRWHAFLLLVHVAGALFLSTGGHFDLQEGQWGDIMVISAMAIISYTYLLAGKLSKELGSLNLNGLFAIVSGVLLLPAAIAFSPADAWDLHRSGWQDLLILVILFNVISLSLWYSALSHLEGWLVSALRAVGPVIAAPFAWIFYGQTLSQVQAVGAIVVVVTSALLAKEQRTPPTTPEE